MSDPFVGEIKMFAGTFAPRGWALCDGQLLSIPQYDALFSLLGTIYGGDGRTTFGLPELRGRVPLHQGTGPGLTPRAIGQKSGQETVTLSVAQLPPHGHTLNASAEQADATGAAGNLRARTGDDAYSTSPDVTLASTAIAATGGGASHANVQPFLCINFIIALVGVYPSRS